VGRSTLDKLDILLRQGPRTTIGTSHLIIQKKLKMNEHSINLGHHIQFHDTSILAKKYRYMEHLIREAVETELHQDNMNREEGFCLSRSWRPLDQILKE